MRASHASETPEERKARLEVEAEAKRVSEQIDEELRQERERLRRSRGDVKVSLCIPFSSEAHMLTFVFV